MSSHSQYRGELSEVVKQLITYIHDKYQIPDFSSYILLVLVLEAFRAAYGYVPLRLDIFEKSINSPGIDPLWLKALNALSKLNQQTNIIQELHSKKKLERLET